MKTTRYFDEQVRRKRPYLRDEWIEAALRSPDHAEAQANGRVRFWRYIPSLGHYLRVVTLADGETVHNAFPDGRFRGKRP